MTYLYLPLSLILQFAPVTLPAQREICLQMKGAHFSFPYELIIAIDKPAIFYRNGTILVTSPNNESQSHFQGTAEEMVREYCG